MPTFAPPPDTQVIKAKVFTMNLAQAAATYDLATCNAVGGVKIIDITFYVTVVGATFTSVSCQTNNTTADEFLSAAEGAVANITASKILKKYTTGSYLHTSLKIQYTIVGATGSGTVLVIVRYQPTVSGADIS